MQCRLIITTSVLALVAGCVRYSPQPLTVPDLIKTRDATTFAAEATSPALALPHKEYDQLALLVTAAKLNPALAKARASTQTAIANAHAARVRPGPTLSLVAEYSAAAGGVSPWLVGIATDFLLDIGQRRAGRLASADAAITGALYDYADQLWAVRMTLHRALADRLLAHEEQTIAKQRLQLRTRQFKAMRNRLREGASARPDVEKIRADVAIDQQIVAAAKARAAAANVTLAGALGVAPQALREQPLGWTGLTEPTIIHRAEVARLREPALLARIDVLRAVLNYTQAEEALKTAVAAQYPEIHLAPGYLWERGVSKQPFTLGLALPPLDLNRAAIGAAEAARAEAGKNLEAVVTAALAQIAAAASEYRAAWRALKIVRDEIVPTARALAVQADVELAAGGIDRLEWVASQIGLKTVVLDELTAVGRVRAAEAALEDALRRPLAGPELAIDNGGKWPGDTL